MKYGELKSIIEHAIEFNNTMCRKSNGDCYHNEVKRLTKRLDEYQKDLALVHQVSINGLCGIEVGKPYIWAKQILDNERKVS